MQPITPLLETPTGRLAELIHLLSDTPLTEAVAAVSDASADVATENDDPWWVIAGALVEVRRQKTQVFSAHDLRMPA